MIHISSSEDIVSTATTSSALEPVQVGGNGGGKMDRTCQICSKVFLKPAHLVRHSTTHASVKNHTCSTCSRPFAREDALQRHIRTVHAGVSSPPSSRRADRPRTPRNSTTTTTENISSQQNTTAAPSPSPLWTHAELEAGLFSTTGLPPSDTSTVADPRPLPLPSTSESFDSEALLRDFAGDVQLPPSSSLGLVDPHQPGPFSTLLEYISDPPGSNSELGFDNFLSWWLPSSISPPFNDTPAVWDDGMEATLALASAAAGSQVPGSDCSHATDDGALEGQQTVEDEESHSRLNPRGQVCGACRFGVHGMFQTSTACARHGQPGENTVIHSPEALTETLYIKPAVPPTKDLIPSFAYLNSAIHLYFQYFHPSFPILHKPTFDSRKASPFLVLSVCSIGCMYMGTETDADKGRWIFERLQRVCADARDTISHNPRVLAAILLAATLGQSFALLSGPPTHRFSGESFHGPTINLASRATSAIAPVDYESVAHEIALLDDASLKRYWEIWAYSETLRRATAALHIHTAHLAISTLDMIPAVPPKISHLLCSEKLFESQDPRTWRNTLCQAVERQRVTFGHGPPTDEGNLGFAPYTHLTGLLLSARLEKRMKLPWSSENDNQAATLRLAEYMDTLVPTIGQPSVTTSSSQEISHLVLWHYCLLTSLVDIDNLVASFDSKAPGQVESRRVVMKSLESARGRFAILHCARILQLSSLVQDPFFLVPLSVLHAVQFTISFLIFQGAATETPQLLSIPDDSRWLGLASLASTQIAAPEGNMDPIAQFVLKGGRKIAVDGTFEGHSTQLDIMNLRAKSIRILRRNPTWGLCDVLIERLLKSGE